MYWSWDIKNSRRYTKEAYNEALWIRTKVYYKNVISTCRSRDRSLRSGLQDESMEILIEKLLEKCLKTSRDSNDLSRHSSKNLSSPRFWSQSDFLNLFRYGSIPFLQGFFTEISPAIPSFRITSRIFSGESSRKIVTGSVVEIFPGITIDKSLHGFI